MKGSWERIKEIIQERRQEEIKGFGCWKGIKNQCKSGWVRILDGEQSPCAPGPTPHVLKLTNRHLRTGAAQPDEEELGS